jgi:hypothetical protein
LPTMGLFVWAPVGVTSPEVAYPALRLEKNTRGFDNLFLYILKAISGMNAFIAKAADDLTAGRTFINKGSNFGRPGEIYASYAAHDMENVKAKLNQACGFVKKMAATLSVTAAIKGYEGWASSQIASFKQALRHNAGWRGWARCIFFSAGLRLKPDITPL